MTTIGNLRTDKPGPNDVRIDRMTKWGNPFRIGRDGTREEVIQKCREWVPAQPDLMSSLEELRGKRLMCWCTPKACHGLVYLELLGEKLPPYPYVKRSTAGELRKLTYPPPPPAFLAALDAATEWRSHEH